MTPAAATGRLRVAVIGVGHLGRHHVRLLREMPAVELVAAVDVVAERARAAVDGSSAAALENYRDVLDRVDAVTIAVPTSSHLEVARDCLDRGLHVLVEKPMAVSLEDASAMLACADAAGVRLAVGHTERFNPALQAAIPALRRPRFIEVHRLSGFPDRSLDIDVIFDVMIHDLDVALTVDGSDVVSVEAIGVPVLTSRVDIANARIRFASGCVANVTASRISRDKIRKLRCFQPDMYVSIDYASQDLEVWRLEGRGEGRPSIAGGPVPVAKEEPLGRELADFVDAIRTGRPPLVTGQEGYRALALATRVADAIRAGQPDGATLRTDEAPDVPIAPQAAAGREVHSDSDVR
jgi:predicted dehydrogenase